MSARLFEKGRQGFADGSLDWDTHNFKIVQLLLDGTATDVAIKAITAASNATPIVITSTSHGFANGDVLVIRGILGNTAANGTWQIANQAANTFELKTLKDNQNSTGNGAYTSGGCVINLTLADMLDDISAARVGSDSSNLTTPTVTNGVLDADDVTFTSVTGTIHAHAIYRDAGSEATDRTVYFMDGRTQVTVAADAASSATTLWVEQLEGIIPNGATMIFSNGITATVTSQAAAFARSIAVSALSGAIAAGHTADVQTLNSGLPITISSGSYIVQFDSGVNKIVKL
jgi:hypothetical protein